MSAGLLLAAMLAYSPVTVSKTVALVSDPLDGSIAPKAIPGAKLDYTIRVTNTSGAITDNGALVVRDAIPAGMQLCVADLSGPGSGPVIFLQGLPASGLVYSFVSLSSSTDDLSFSRDNGATYTYSPTAGSDGCDPLVTNIQVKPRNTMNPTGSFTVRFRVAVK